MKQYIKKVKYKKKMNLLINKFNLYKINKIALYKIKINLTIKYKAKI